MKYKKLAKRIADELFRSGDGAQARRLALVILDEGDSRQMSGWGKLAATDRIQMVIENFFARPTKPKK